MNEKFNNTQTGSFDTIQLNENDESTTSDIKRKISAVKSYVRNSCYKIRKVFSSYSDKSVLANVLDKLYFSIIGCSIKLVGIFLFSFSVVSLFLGYISNRTLFTYFTNINNFGSIILLSISLIFLASKKNVCDVLSGSKLFSNIGFVYNQVSILEFNINTKKTGEGYLTAFFAGVLCGIISIFYPSATIALFVVALVLVILILNRPECGLLLTVFISPFFNTSTSVYLITISFIALIYKFLRGKRHIDFGLSEIFLSLTGVYVLLRGLYPASGVCDISVTLKYVCLFFTCIATISLIRTTSMLRRAIDVIVSVSKLYILILTIYFICCVLFSTQTVNIYLDNLALSGIIDSVTNANFLVPFVTLTLPLNFVYLIEKKSVERVKNAVFFTLIFATSVFFKSYVFILMMIVSCVAVIIFSKPKFAFLLIPTPAIAFGLLKLYEFIPDRFDVSISSNYLGTTDGFIESMINNFVLGIGLSETLTANTNSTILNIIICIGAFGALLLAVSAFFLLFKSFRFIFFSKFKANNLRVHSVGLLCSSLSYIATSFYTNTLSDFRVSMLFAVIISLSYISERCFKADYIDPSMVREHN